MDLYKFDSDANLWSEIDEKVWIRLNTWLCDDKYIVSYPFRMIDWDHEVSAIFMQNWDVWKFIQSQLYKVALVSLKCTVFFSRYDKQISSNA